MVMLGVAVAAVPPRLLPWAGGGVLVPPGAPLPGSAAAAAALVLDPAMVACGIVCFAFPALASTIKVGIRSQTRCRILTGAPLSSSRPDEWGLDGTPCCSLPMCFPRPPSPALPPGRE